MILSKAGRLSLLAGLLCLLLMGFTGAANAVIRWDVFPSPTEVINSGRSEVLGSITLVVQQNQTPPILTGNILGGPTQIGILFNNRMMIDNQYTTTGIKLWTNNTALNSVLCLSGCTNPNTQMYLTVTNIDITGTGQYAGLATINIPGNIAMNVGDVVRVDGIRGRVDKSDLANPGTDGFAQLQSINDPAGNQFFPETIRVAKSFLPFTVTVTSDTATLCLPSFGTAPTLDNPLGLLLAQNITVRENFVRAFVSRDSNGSGPDATDRLDSRGQILGSPTNGTMLRVYLNTLPSVVEDVIWPDVVPATGGGAFVRAASRSFTRGTLTTPGSSNAIYEYTTSNQAGASDATLETFIFQPALVLQANANQEVPQLVRAGVSLYPGPAAGEPASGVYAPYGTSSYPLGSGGGRNDVGTDGRGPSMPRFVINYYSGTATSTASNPNSANDPSPTGTVATTQFGIYERFAPCVCYLLYPYTTKDNFWDTGIVVANTSDDSGAIPTGQNAPRMAGTITFWLYDFRLGNVTPAGGVFFADAAHIVPTGETRPAFTSTTPPQPIYYAGQSVRGLVSQLVGSGTDPIATTLANRGFTDFAGYVIAKANFQYCHGYGFVADRTFANIAQGYIANVIPDPTVKGGRRLAAAAGDIFNLPAGESINN